jgi:hypothetical protein
MSTGDSIKVLRAIADLAITVFIDTICGLPAPIPGYGRGNIHRHLSQPMKFIAMKMTCDHRFDIVSIDQLNPLFSDLGPSTAIDRIVIKILHATLLV